MTDQHVGEVAATSSRLGEGLGQLLAGHARGKDRLLLLKEMGAALWVRGRDDTSHLTARAAELLAGAVTRLPIREPVALQAQYGTDLETAAERLVEEAASLARWVWATAAVVPAPPPVVHLLKVFLHSAIEIRLIGELYALYGERGAPRDSAWLNTILHAWALGHPVAAGPSSVVGAQLVAAKLRRAHVDLVSDESRLSRVARRGRDGGDAMRALGLRFRRRLRLDPSGWARPTDLSTADVMRTVVAGAVVAGAVRDRRLGLKALKSTALKSTALKSTALAAPAADASPDDSDDPRPHLEDAWSQHGQARSAAAAASYDAGGTAVLARLNSALDLQERHLRSLGVRLRRPRPALPALPTVSAVPGVPAVSAPRHGERMSDPLAAAYAHTAQADDAIDRAEDAGARPRRLAGWPVPVRNGMVYALASLALSAPVGTLVMSGSDVSNVGTLALLSLPWCGVVWLAYGAGLLTVGALFRPWLGGPVPRSPILGLAISAAVTSVVMTTAVLLSW